MVTLSQPQPRQPKSLLHSPAKLAAYSIVGLLVVTIFCLGWMAYRIVQQTRRLAGEQSQRLARLEEQISRTSQQVSGLAQSNQDMLASLSLPAKLWSDFSGGVCLISGSYVFIDSNTGKPVRAPRKQKNESGPPVSGDAEQPQSTIEAEGPVAEVTFEGTGFHVGDGYVLTNRHIAEPWKYSFWPQLFSSLRNAKPRMAKLLAFFPGHPQPYTLRVGRVSSYDDFAVCKLSAAEEWKGIPALPLDHNSEPAKVGLAVTVMGYPDGEDRLLAALPKGDAPRLVERYGKSSLSLIRQLARRDLIKPMTAQGHVMDLYEDRIVYDAANGEGSSGSPLFGPSGRVIGVNFGYFLQNKASNYAVPIGRGIRLLQQADWKTVE
ncbi:MAG TPA: serine protease [Blastocatellia bacterium]|nr:serine protease [Blastocatellia bacterium]HMZ21765.1 serine protease [Blastocatellia bacterium]